MTITLNDFWRGRWFGGGYRKKDEYHHHVESASSESNAKKKLIFLLFTLMMISTNKRFEERNFSFVLFQQEKTTFKIKWNGCIDTIGMRVYIYKYSSIHGVGGMATVPAEVIFWPFLSQFLFFVGGIHLEGEKSMWVSESRRESICQAC